MRQPIKLLLGVVAACSATGLAFFGWSVKATNDATVRFANGVQVTRVEVQPDDTALALDTEIWKFNVKPPTADKPYQETLNVCQHGKILHTIGGFGIDPDKGEHLQVTICMTPIDDNIIEAQRIKYAIRGVIVGKFGDLRGDGGNSGSFANPLKGLDGGALYAPDGPANNEVMLMSGHNNRSRDNSNINDISIVFQVEPLVEPRVTH